MLSIAVLLSMVAEVPLTILSRGGGSGGVWVALIPFAIVGAVIARRQPWNPVGSVLLLLTFAVVASSDAAHYAVLRYRDGDHDLPLARVAVVLAPGGWMWLVVLLPLTLALFPDGRLSRPWLRVLWAHLALGAAFVATSTWQSTSGILAKHIQIDSNGQLVSNSSAGLSTAYTVTILLYLAFGLVWVGRLLLSYRRSTGDYRQQLKWLLAGGAIAVIGLVLAFSSNGTNSQILRVAGNVGLGGPLFAIPISLGISILKYRLYEIDRLVSRTLSYAILTGLLVAIYLAVVALTTRALPFSSPVGVAASTLAAAALFNPLRRRVQHLVDHRFNRARYDADATVAAFTAQLRDAIDLNNIGNELVRAVDRAVQPSHASLWIRQPGRRAPS